MMKPETLLHFREDRWPVAFTVMVLAVQVTLFFRVEQLWLALVLVLAFQPVQAVAIACNHYQHHKNVFKASPWNRIYEVVLFLQTGMPPYLITLHHNLGHHLHYLDGVNDTLNWRRRDGEPFSRWRCLLQNTWGHVTGTIAIGRRFPKVYRRLKIWLGVSALPLAVLCALDWRQTLVVFVLPMVLALANVARLGYHQHAGVDGADHLTASRNIESALYNRVTFNSGYHAAHHLKPGVHWSRLPELHREIRADIPAELLAGHHTPSPRERWGVSRPRADSPGAAP